MDRAQHLREESFESRIRRNYISGNRGHVQCKINISKCQARILSHSYQIWGLNSCKIPCDAWQNFNGALFGQIKKEFGKNLGPGKRKWRILKTAQPWYLCTCKKINDVMWKTSINVVTWQKNTMDLTQGISLRENGTYKKWKLCVTIFASVSSSTWNLKHTGVLKYSLSLKEARSQMKKESNSKKVRQRGCWNIVVPSWPKFKK